MSIDFTNDFLSSSIAWRYSGGRLLPDSVTTCNVHMVENRTDNVVDIYSIDQEQSLQ